jgi:hypothetical protein
MSRQSESVLLVPLLSSAANTPHDHSACQRTVAASKGCTAPLKHTECYDGHAVLPSAGLQVRQLTVQHNKGFSTQICMMNERPPLDVDDQHTFCGRSHQRIALTMFSKQPKALFRRPKAASDLHLLYLATRFGKYSTQFLGTILPHISEDIC